MDSTDEHLSPEGNLFALPPLSIKRTYYVALAKGNRLQVERSR